MESIRQRLAGHRPLGLDVAIALAAFAVPTFSFGARSDAEPDASELGTYVAASLPYESENA